MGKDSVPTTLLKVPKSRWLIATAAAAIHRVSLESDKLVTMREAAMRGLDYVQSDRPRRLKTLLDEYERYRFFGDNKIYVALKDHEMDLLYKCHERFVALWEQPLDRVEIVILGVLRMRKSRPAERATIPTGELLDS